MQVALSFGAKRMAGITLMRGIPCNKRLMGASSCLALKVIQTQIMPITTFTWSKRTKMAPKNGAKLSAILTPEKRGILFNRLRTEDTSLEAPNRIGHQASATAT